MAIATPKHERQQYEGGVGCSCGKEWGHEQAESLVSVGLWRTPEHRYYWQEPGKPLVGPLTSVTTALKALDKPSIVMWAKRETAACAIRNLPMVTEMVKTGGPQAAIDWLKRIPDYQRDASADLGTRVHILAEKVATGGDPAMTADEAPFVAAYRNFLDDYKPTFLRIEAMVCNLTYSYAGTLDFLAALGGKVTLVDIKTGSGAYPETSLQLAGLANGEFLGWPNDPRKHPLPHIEQYAVLHLRPELYPDTGYRLIPYKVTPETFWRFLAVKETWEWLQGEAKTVMGAPLGAPTLEVAA